MTFWTEDKTHYQHDLRIFVEGQELSEHMTGSVQVSYGSTSEFNTGAFIITNPKDLYTFVERNLGGSFYKSESAKSKLYQHRSSLKAKGAWDNSVGAPIFRYRDCVRVFELRHDDPSKWRHLFTGYVSNCTPSFSFETGEKNLAFTCGDIRDGILKKKRFQSNVVTGEVTPEFIDRESESLFRDLITSTQQENTHLLAGMSFENILFMLFTGHIRNEDGVFEEFPGAAPIGKITHDPVFEVDSPEKMEEIHDSIWGESLTYDEVTAIGEQTLNGGDYSPHGPNTSVKVVIPPSGNKSLRSFMEVEFFDGGSEERSWETYAAMIDSLCERLEYQFHVHPNGKIVFEPVLYDHLPSHFGEYEGCFIADVQLKDEFSLIPSEESIVSCVIVTGGCDTVQFRDGAETIRQPRVAVYNKDFQRLYGTNVEEVDFPFTRDQDKLRIFAAIEYQKRLMAATNLAFGLAWRPGLWLNRPIFFNGQYVSRLKTLGYDIGFEAEPTINVEVDAIRFLDEDGKFLTITNEESSLINWGQLYGEEETSVILLQTKWMDMSGSERDLKDKLE